jgi:hypothetical protein
VEQSKEPSHAQNPGGKIGFEILGELCEDSGMAKYRHPTIAFCNKCNKSCSVTVEVIEAEIDWDSLETDYKPARQIVTVNCDCVSPRATYSYPTKAKEAPVTEKQYSTEPLKNDALKAVSKAFKTVEETLLSIDNDRKAAAVRAAVLVANALDRLDKTLLEAGQSGILFTDLEEAFPADATVLTNRLESVWAVVSFDNLENVA